MNVHIAHNARSALKNSARDLPHGGGVYAIIHMRTKACYVGQSKDVHSRVGRHISQLRSGFHHSRPLQQAFNQYGEDAFVAVLLEAENDPIRRPQAELVWFHKLDASFNQATPWGWIPGTASPHRPKPRHSQRDLRWYQWLLNNPDIRADMEFRLGCAIEIPDELVAKQAAQEASNGKH